MQGRNFSIFFWSARDLFQLSLFEISPGRIKNTYTLVHSGAFRHFSPWSYITLLPAPPSENIIINFDKFDKL